MTRAELLNDFWGHLHTDDPNLRNVAEDDDFLTTQAEFGISPDDLMPIASDDEADVLAEARYE